MNNTGSITLIDYPNILNPSSKILIPLTLDLLKIVYEKLEELGILGIEEISSEDLITIIVLERDISPEDMIVMYSTHTTTDIKEIINTTILEHESN